jgi:hypothetical protein
MDETTNPQVESISESLENLLAELAPEQRTALADWVIELVMYCHRTYHGNHFHSAVEQMLEQPDKTEPITERIVSSLLRGQKRHTENIRQLLGNLHKLVRDYSSLANNQQTEDD